MKRKEFLAEIGKLPTEELKQRARGLAEELMRLRFRKSGGQLEQTHRLGELKRSLARVETMITRRANDARRNVEQSIGQ